MMHTNQPRRYPYIILLVLIFLAITALLPDTYSLASPIDPPKTTRTTALPATQSTLIPVGATWKYLDNGTNQGTNWRAAGFNDSGWVSGPAKLGYGDSGMATTIGYGGNSGNKYITTYFRNSFNVSNPAFTYLSFRLLRDDGAIVYLNGTEVFRSNMPAGTVSYTTLATTGVGGTDETAFFEYLINPGLLVNGANVLAVEVHQNAPDSSDLSFDLELKGITSNGTVRVGVIGDFGIAGQPEQDVANLVKSWNPDFIVTVGDNNYPLGAATTIDQNIGQYYHQYIYPYVGSYGAGAVTNRFFPVPGNHDWESGIAPYLNYFTLPGNERYYDFVNGPLQFFGLDSDPREPDGINSTSVQAMWLRSRLGVSTAPWKLVLLHHPPYSSGLSHGSTPALQWPYATWGASAVLAGHEHLYERLQVGSIPYFVNGAGGQSLYTFSTPLPTSQVRISNDYGAMLVEADAETLTFRYITRDNQVVDSYTMNRAPVAPSALTASTISPSQINLSWSDNSYSENGFYLERKQGLNGSWVQLPATLTTDTISYSDTGLSPGTVYFYRIRAYNGYGNSAYSNEVSAATPGNFVVTENTDNGGNGTLSNALNSAVNGDVITFALTNGDTIIFNPGITLPAAKVGVKILGSCSNAGPGVIINGSGGSADSFTLSGNNQLYGIAITHFNGQQVVTPGKGNATACVRIIK